MWKLGTLSWNLGTCICPSRISSSASNGHPRGTLHWDPLLDAHGNGICVVLHRHWILQRAAAHQGDWPSRTINSEIRDSCRSVARLVRLQGSPKTCPIMYSRFVLALLRSAVWEPFRYARVLGWWVEEANYWWIMLIHSLLFQNVIPWNSECWRLSSDKPGYFHVAQIRPTGNGRGSPR